MSTRQEQADYTRLMERYEEAMSDLYKQYAAVFPRYKTAWQHLASAEIQHADWVRTLRARIQDGSVQVSEERSVEPERITGSLDRVANELVRAKGAAIIVVDAFATALQMEGEMIEKEWFGFFEADSPELRRVFQSLATETSKHVEALQKLWDAEVNRRQEQ